MTRGFFPYKSSRISYLHFGRGPQWVICFHGFDESATQFAFLERHAADRFRFLAIDLPFHGETDWQEGYDCDPSEFYSITRDIFNSLGGAFETSRSYLLGFSLGSRIALSLYELHPDSFVKLVLLAPDGLKVNAWYWLATQTVIGNGLFAYTMRKPSWFFTVLKMMNRLGTVNSSVFKFVNFYIGDKEIRRLLYARWTTLRKFKPSLPKIRRRVLSNQSRVNLLYGKHDRIILSVRGDRFRRGIESNSTLRIIASGHQVLHEKHVEDILVALLH